MPRWANVKTKQIRVRLGNPHDLPSVAQVKQQFRFMLRPHVRNMLKELKDKHRQELKPLLKQKREMIQRHKLERQRLKAKQAKRWAQETKIRQARLHKGLRGLWDWLSGRAKQVRQQNEQEAWAALKRDQIERDGLIVRHLMQRQEVQWEVKNIRTRYREERQGLAHDIGKAFKLEGRKASLQVRVRADNERMGNHGPSFER